MKIFIAAALISMLSGTPTDDATTIRNVAQLRDASVNELLSPVAGTEPVDPDIRIEVPEGGWAVAVRQVDGTDIPGRHWLLASGVGVANIKIWDSSTYVPANREHPQTVSSNLIAHGTAEKLTGLELPLVDFTTASGDGPSGGLVYLIAYLDLATDGGFTNGLSVAATGAMGRNGTVHPVQSGQSKLLVADAVDADVLFTGASVDMARAGLDPAAHTNVANTAHPAGTPLSVQRDWDIYHDAGAAPHGEAMSVVQVRHIGDVAAYLCGTGSSDACGMLDTLETFTYDVPKSDTARSVAALLDTRSAASSHDAKGD